jgi:hypothetical protein
VMGIVASQVLERHYRPVFVVAQGKGSVRSTPGISAVEGLRAASPWLQRWGGHAAAAGFSLDEAHFDRFRDAIYEYVASHAPPARTVTADAVLRPEQVTTDFHASLAALEPYGQGHPAPRFAIQGPLTRLRAVGKGGSHLQLSLGAVKGVAWNRGSEADRWPLGTEITAFASLTESTFRDTTTVELRAEALTDSGRMRLAADANDAATVTDASRRLTIGSSAPAPGARRITSLALDPNAPLDPLAELRAALGRGGAVHLDLDPAELEALARAAEAYPGVHDVRLAFVQTQRGRPWPWKGLKADLMQAVLRELDLVDERGRARSGQRRDPYDAPTLRASLVARHALDTVVNVIRALSPDDAALAVLALLGRDGDEPAGARALVASDALTHAA